MAVSFFFDGRVLTVLLGGNLHLINKENPAYRAIKAKLKDGKEADILNLLKTTTSNFVVDAANAKIEVRDNKVFYNGVELNNSITEKIVTYIQEDLPHAPLMAFLKNVMMNPDPKSRDELFEFLSNKKLPITDDGHFIGYKAVQSNFKDVYTGTIDNSVGTTVRMKRSEVDNNRGVHCGKGLHLGTIEYAQWYKRHNSDKDIIFVLVKVHPANAVSVPSDHSCQKLRTCEYTVISMYKEDLEAKVYDSELNAILPVTKASFDDYDDVDDEDDWEEECDICGEPGCDEDCCVECEEDDITSDFYYSGDMDEECDADDVETFNNDEEDVAIDVKDADKHVPNYRHAERDSKGRFKKKKKNARKKK